MKKIIVSLTVAAFATVAGFAGDTKASCDSKAVATKQCSSKATTACAGKSEQAKSRVKTFQMAKKF
ncbi:MAG: hypothetical protein EXS36_01225 [Pedosphaera sp.]|nr:hypothetical protein [Pedosphaera sp.]